MTKNKTKKYILYAITFVVAIIAAFIYLNKNYIDNYYEYINKETIKDKEDGWSYIDDINNEISNDANNIVKEIINNPTTSEEKNIKEANEIKKKIEKESFIFSVKTGNDGKVFGSISSKQICEKMNELGYNINKKMILSDESLSSLGTFYVDVLLYKGVIAKVKIELIKK